MLRRNVPLIVVVIVCALCSVVCGSAPAAQISAPAHVAPFEQYYIQGGYPLAVGGAPQVLTAGGPRSALPDVNQVFGGVNTDLPNSIAIAEAAHEIKKDSTVLDPIHATRHKGGLITFKHLNDASDVVYSKMRNEVQAIHTQMEKVKDKYSDLTEATRMVKVWTAKLKAAKKAAALAEKNEKKLIHKHMKAMPKYKAQLMKAVKGGSGGAAKKFFFKEVEPSSSDAPAPHRITHYVSADHVVPEPLPST